MHNNSSKDNSFLLDTSDPDEEIVAQYNKSFEKPKKIKSSSKDKTPNEWVKLFASVKSEIHCETSIKTWD
jgi:hypothetical protein